MKEGGRTVALLDVGGIEDSVGILGKNICKGAHPRAASRNGNGPYGRNTRRCPVGVPEMASMNKKIIQKNWAAAGFSMLEALIVVAIGLPAEGCHIEIAVAVENLS